MALGDLSATRFFVQGIKVMAVGGHWDFLWLVYDDVLAVGVAWLLP